MTNLQPLPRRTWAEQSALFLAGTLWVVGAMTLVGWWLTSDELLQPLGVHAPFSANAAVGFAFLSLALLALETGRSRGIALAGVAVMIGAATLAQDILGRDFHIDQLLVVDHLQAHLRHPGRMSPVMAIVLMLAGGVLLWRMSRRGVRLRLLVEAGLGALIASIGGAALIGYAAELPAVYTWGAEAAIGPLAASALILVGLDLLQRAWRDRSALSGGAPPWAPLPVFIACTTLTAVLWLGLRARELAYIAQTTNSQLEQFAMQSRDALDKQLSQLERLARTWGDGTANATAAWESDALRLLAQETGSLGCLSLSVVNRSYRTVWTQPREGNPPRQGFNHADVLQRRVALQQAETSQGRPTVSESTLVAAPTGAENGLVIYAPIIRGGALAGFVAAEFPYREFFRHIATTKMRLKDEHDIAVWLGDELVFAPTSSPPRTSAFTTDRVFSLAGRRVRVSVTPVMEVLAQSRRHLPGFALVAGMGIALLLTLSVHLARHARAGQRAAELSNRRLFSENEERRRIEERLKVSDERLRLALDSTQIGIFEWSVGAGHVFYSPGLWAMLGYDHATMPTTVEAWQSLIHPDDLAAYRRRTDAQLAGITTFIDPEHRVRTRNGDWCWVCTRAKSVAAGPDGRPSRIIGTVQDISARREAELALRESQADARKLSLVAAKTDSPVLIGSADGRIEWANAAFCRVMEYDLGEVVGRSPTHFMAGPESDPTVLARIQSSLTRGQALNTDVLNYSKSGRKFHMNIEIQPVRGASGDFENFIAVQTDLTARVETEQQLRRAKAEADDASRAKSEFLASMSHEIRTPMNGVIGMTSLLMETRLGTEQRDYVNTIRSSGETLLTIINDILDFSKIESGKMELEHAAFDLAHCLEEALDLFAATVGARNVELGYLLAADVPPWIVGDVTRLRQIVVNLVNNAVKFTPGGSISVMVRRAPAGSAPPHAPVRDPAEIGLEFAVRDTGIGVPPDRVGRLFKAFSQIDSSTTRKYGGTGLGLAICQRLCQLMGGTVRVESTVGEGSVFTFTIRTRAAPAPAAPPAAGVLPFLRDRLVLCIEDNSVTGARLCRLFEEQGVECLVVPTLPDALEQAPLLSRPPALVVIDAGQFDGAAAMDRLAPLACPRLFLYAFGQTVTVAPAADQPFASTTKPIRTAAFHQALIELFNAASQGRPASTVERPRLLGEEFPLEILLAEDNSVNQKVAIRYLERLGYRVDAVSNGLEAVTTLEYRCYDLVFMDLQMPEMDGFEATRLIRSRIPGSRQPKIIALTANAMQGDREQCTAAGMDDYISKPVKLEEMSDAIRRQFGRPVGPYDGSRLIG